MGVMIRAIRHFFYGLYCGYPLCCVVSFTLMHLANPKALTAFLAGCWSDERCDAGYAHCHRCAQKKHPGRLLMNMENETVEWMPECGCTEISFDRELTPEMSRLVINQVMCKKHLKEQFGDMVGSTGTV